MKKYTYIIVQGVCFSLIILWIYAAASKLMDFNMFYAQMHRQLMFTFIKVLLPFVLPPLEIAAALLLALKQTRFAGLVFSFWMLLVFTVYIAVAMSKWFGKVPCSCGGILSKMSWGTHLSFNILFLLLTVLGIYISYRERRMGYQAT